MSQHLGSLLVPGAWPHRFALGLAGQVAAEGGYKRGREWLDSALFVLGVLGPEVDRGHRSVEVERLRGEACQLVRPEPRAARRGVEHRPVLSGKSKVVPRAVPGDADDGLKFIGRESPAVVAAVELDVAA
ncbi:MAG: hypothetical protein U0797_26195 [Gemmataceae bacterium]